MLAVRTTGSVSAVAEEVKRIAAQLDPVVAISDIEGMDVVVAQALAQPPGELAEGEIASRRRSPVLNGVRSRDEAR